MTQRIRAIRAYCPSIEIIRRVETKGFGFVHFTSVCGGRQRCAPRHRGVAQRRRLLVLRAPVSKLKDRRLFATIDLAGTIQIRLRPDRTSPTTSTRPASFWAPSGTGKPSARRAMSW